MTFDHSVGQADVLSDVPLPHPHPKVESSSGQEQYYIRST